MEYPQEQVIEFLKQKQIYLIAFPRYSSIVKGCKQFIYFDDDSFFNVQFNFARYGIDEFEYYSEDEFMDLLGNLAYDTIPDDFFTGYDDIPESLISEARDRKQAIDALVEKLRDEVKWLKLPVGTGWYLHYNQLLGWHKLLVRNDKIQSLSLQDEETAKSEINGILVQNPDTTIENINQYVIVQLFRAQKQAIRYINAMVPDEIGLFYRDSSYEEALKILHDDRFYSLTFRDERIDSVRETSFRVMMEDLVGLLVVEKQPSAFEITEDLSEEISYIFTA